MASPRGKLVYNFLGNSGLRVSNMCLGTITFGEPKGKTGPKMCTEQESHAILDRFKEMGGNFIDTADVYSEGKSEEILGSWLSKQKRDHFVIATKVRGNMDPGSQNASGLSRGHIMQAVDNSLHRLQTDYIDLYQIHCWDSGVPIEETLSALNDLVHQGKVRYIGASNVLGWQMQKIAELCKYNNWVPMISLQQQWNLLVRETEYEVVEVCRNEGIGILPWSPLKGGWLTGKYKKGATFEEGSRIGWASENTARVNQSHPSFQQYDSDKTWNLITVMEDISLKHGASVSQVALRWLLQKDVVPSVVIGVKTLPQLEDNVGAASGWKLTDDEMSLLDKVSAPEIPYPYEMVWRLNANRIRRK